MTLNNLRANKSPDEASSSSAFLKNKNNNYFVLIFVNILTIFGVCKMFTRL
jgi:hypothetical protein